MVATDVTSEKNANLEAQKHAAFVRQTLAVVNNKNAFRKFVRDCQLLIEDWAHKDSQRIDNREQFLRDVHSLKGIAATYYLENYVEICHHIEEMAKAEKKHAEIKNQFANLSAALKSDLAPITKALGDFSNSDERFTEISVKDLWSINPANSPLENYEENWKCIWNKYGLVEIKSYFSIYESYCDYIASQNQKKVAPFIYEGGDLRITPEPYVSFFRATAHIFRNFIDHGIETIHERIQLKKPEAGTIQVKINKKQEGGNSWLAITFEDDGQGINCETIRKKLGLAKGHLDDQVLLQKIFEPGFSTRQEVTTTSGRGIGLNAVWAEVQKLNGKIWVTSQLGQGTRISILLPWLEEFVPEIKISRTS